jgi:hypothetical protein
VADVLMAADAFADFISDTPHVWIRCKKLEAFLDIVCMAFRLPSISFEARLLT